MDIVEREQLQKEVVADHWYYESKYQLLRMHLRSMALNMEKFRLADVGTGLGLFLHMLEVDGLASPLRSVGIDPGYSIPGKVFQSDIPIYPRFPQGENYDTLLLMDVLEHVENDTALLQEVIPYLQDQGYILITVPALPLLWSGHDRFLGHFRRYTISSLRSLIIRSGKLEILSLHYHFAAILPAALPVRMFHSFVKNPDSSDMRPLAAPLNWLLKKLCILELHLSQKNTFAGLSVVALCKKK